MENPDDTLFFIVPVDIIYGSRTKEQAIEFIKKELNDIFSHVSGDGFRAETGEPFYFLNSKHSRIPIEQEQ